MSRISGIIIILLLFLTASQAAAEWTLVTTINDVEMFIDNDSVNYPAFQVAKAWRKYEFGEPMQQAGKELSTLYVYSEEDCAGNRLRVFEEIVIYSDDEIKVESYPDPQWEPVERESFNYSLHERVCR